MKHNNIICMFDKFLNAWDFPRASNSSLLKTRTCWSFIVSTLSWLLMSWWCKVPGHQQPCCWPSYPGVFQFQNHQNKRDEVLILLQIPILLVCNQFIYFLHFWATEFGGVMIKFYYYFQNCSYSSGWCAVAACISFCNVRVWIHCLELRSQMMCQHGFRQPYLAILSW